MSDGDDLAMLKELAEEIRSMGIMATVHAGEPGADLIVQMVVQLRAMLDGLASRPGSLRTPLPWWEAWRSQQG